MANDTSSTTRYRGRGQRKAEEVKTKGLTPSGPHTPVSGEDYSDHMNTEKFDERLKKIKPYIRLPYEKLPVEVMRVSDSLIHVLNLSSESQKATLLAYAKQHFELKSLDGLVPGTLAAKFFGCQVNSCPEVELGCSPLCAGSVSGDCKHGWKQCSSPVLEFQDGTFKTFSAGHGSGDKTAYVYVKSDFKGFTAVQVQELKQRGIEQIRLIQYDSSTNKCTQASPSFVAVESYLIKNRGNLPNPGQPFGTANMASGWWILFWVLIAIIVIAILYAIFRGRKDKKKRVTIRDEEEEEEPSSPSMYYSGMTPRYPWKSMVPYE